MNGTVIQIYDTGMEEKGGSIVYTSRGHTDWVNLYAKLIRPEINYITTNYESKKLTEDLVDYVGNRIESKNPPRFTITSSFPITAITDLQKILAMGNTLGLKKIRGGLGTLGLLGTDVYVIITAIQISEVLNTAVDNISVTISLQQV